MPRLPYTQHTESHVLLCCSSPPHPHERRGRSVAGIRQHKSVEISANDPRLLPAVFTVALPGHTRTKRHLWPTCWLILKLLLWSKRKFSCFSGEQGRVVRACMGNGEQRQTNTEQVSHGSSLESSTLPLERYSSSNPAVNHYLCELVHYSSIVCPAKSCQAPLLEVLTPSAGLDPDP